jgi:deoxyribose-phosphate aldolase
MIDSTNVKAAATRSEIANLCAQMVEYGFGCVCVNPVYVKLAARILKGSNARLSSIVGFPFGASLLETKAFETVKAVQDGADKVEMVINLSSLKSGDFDAVKQDIAAVVNVKHARKDIIVKIIIETAYLTREEKVIACKLAKEAGADFVKTSTGFFGSGATVEDVRLMRQTVGKNMGVKAAGNIRTYVDAVAMIEAGANRIGTSAAATVTKDAPS